MSVCSSGRASPQAVLFPPATVSAPFFRAARCGWCRLRIGGAARPRLHPAIRASVVDGSSSTSDFAKRIEKAWLISQDHQPIVCPTCQSNGHVECKWCGGTGFFILGDNMLCEVPSRNTTCVVCAGKGSACCPDCQGTGFRAKWLGQPPERSP